MTKKTLIIMVLLGAVLFVFTSCGKTKDINGDDQGKTPVKAKPVEGKSLRQHVLSWEERLIRICL